ncbi:hypothetical protein OROGR_004680 [Orobanche gracilis]
MAAKLLHSLTDENPDLQKQIGCMTGIFHLFDRQHILNGGGGRLVGHGSKRLPRGNSHFHSLERDSRNTHLRFASAEKYSHKSFQEDQRISTESSQASFSSSSRSSFSSLDCKPSAQLEPASYDRVIFPETPPRNPSMSLHNSYAQFSQQSLNIRDFVKDSMYMETHAHALSINRTRDEAADSVKIERDSPRPQSKTSSELKDSLKVLVKFEEAPWYQNEPRELLRSASFHVKEGSSFSVSRDAPRFSCDEREFSLMLKDNPRISLDGRESSMRHTNAEPKSDVFLKYMQKDSNFEFDGKVQNLQQIGGHGHQTRPPSIVAKLMGLEPLPDSVSSFNDGDFVNIIPRSSEKTGQISIQTSNFSKTSCKEPTPPRSSVKPMSRFPIEPAPWKHIDSSNISQKPTVEATRAQAKASTTFHSVYNEIEKRLKDLEFTQSGKDLRALKQILEAMQSKGLLETKNEVRGSTEQKHSSPNNHEASLVNNNHKQVLDSPKRRTRHYESPIVILKPAKLVRKSGLPAAARNLSSKASQQDNASVNNMNMKNDRTPKSTQRSLRVPQLAKDGNGELGKNSGSISPRMEQKKPELEKRSRPPTYPDSSKSKRQQNKPQSEFISPGGRRRPKHQQSGDHPIEVIVESRYMNHRETASSVQLNETVTRNSKHALTFMLPDLVDEKSTRVLSEEELGEFGFVPPEYSSPVSVLDKVVCKDDSPSPMKYVGKPQADVYIDKEMDSSMVQGSSMDNFVQSSSTSEISRKKLQNIENLVQKLRRLNSTHDEARTDYIASLCENTNPDHRYISEILLASGLLLRELGSTLTSFKFHPSGHPINPALFFVLEQTKASTVLEEEYGAENPPQLVMEQKFHRRLIFDAVNEILARKLASGDPSSQPWPRPVKLGKRAMYAQRLLRELCSEIEVLQAKNWKYGSGEEDETWRDILSEDVMLHSENWINFDDEISGAVLDIERSIFKDLVNEIVISESSDLRTKRGMRRLFVK